MSAQQSQVDSLQQQYRARFSEASQYRNSLWSLLCEEFFQKYIRRDCVLLDLGCGWGEFSNNIDAGKKYAMDLNPDAAEHLNDDVELLLQDCSQSWPLEDNSLDVVFTSNFLEHLPDKSSIEKTIVEATRCLKPGGQFIALGPNVRLVPGAYWDFWDHHVPISDRSLTELLTLKGLTVVEQHAGFLPYTMSDGRQPNLFLVRLYLKIRLAWRIMGKQFLIVARLYH
ncbi:MAG: SAM-dependent methyltransferase [Halioglobus sp.]|jgi:SAM-dependent methyltransferase